MKKILTYSYLFALSLFVSCGSAENKKTEESNTTLAAANFKSVLVRHPVADFAAWKIVHDANDSIRQVYGITPHAIGRSMEESNQVIIFNKFTDVQKANEFVALPALKEIMQKAGVTGEPLFDFIDVIRNDESKTEIKDRFLIKHRVKDFDAWLKVFDAEGMKSRSDNGVIDRGMGRGSEDPNMVYLVFAISDMAKAKARVGSEELKEVMMKAGVEGPPEIVFYTLVD